MREPEFLPSWYPLLLRRRQMVVVQSAITIILLFALTAWGWIGQREEKSANLKLAGVTADLAKTGFDLHRLSEIEHDKHELEKRDRIVQRLGIHVPVARILTELDALMPARMALLSINLETQETQVPLTAAEQATGVTPKVQRKMKIRIVGLAPNEDDLAIFITQLVSRPYFAEVGVVKSEDHADNGHLMRQFEVKFALNLDSSDSPALASGGD